MNYLKEIVLSALSATARALSMSVVWRWKAMYCNHTTELLGDDKTTRSKSSAVSGTRSWSKRDCSVCRNTRRVIWFTAGWRQKRETWQRCVRSELAHTTGALPGEAARNTPRPYECFCLAQIHNTSIPGRSPTQTICSPTRDKILVIMTNVIFRIIWFYIGLFSSNGITLYRKSSSAFLAALFCLLLFLRATCGCGADKHGWSSV